MSDSTFIPDELFWAYFHELYETLPRQGPGLNANTRKALSYLPVLRADQQVLDIGCGAGVQTLELARGCAARIVATDVHTPFLEIVRNKAAEQGLAERITTQVADMGGLPFPDASFDVIWAEGSSFIIGFEEGLARWRRLLKPGGFMVISEFTWYLDNPPAEVVEFVVGDSPEDHSIAGRRRAIANAGYHLVHEFPLKPEDWWDVYYVPLLERLPEFEARHAGHPQAMAVVERCRHEIDLFKRYPEHFGYAFFIMNV